MTTHDMLPKDITNGASLRGNEYGWSLSEFPNAVAKAEAHGFACLGGQFQFRLQDGGTCEMYWLNADPTERQPNEAWADYVHRSCSEVMQRFGEIAAERDFTGEASNWPSLRDAIERSLPDALVFVAYFITESEYASLRNPQ